MTPILTVTLNPALDLAGECDHVTADTKLRVRNLRTEPGGGGVNVSRAIRNLGGDTTAFVAWAGEMGQWHRRLLDAQKVQTLGWSVNGETRQSLTVTDADGRQFRFVLSGPHWEPAMEHSALVAIQTAARETGGLVVLSGSQPPGVSDGFAAGLAHGLGPGRLIVDTSGAALARLVRHPRPDQRPMVMRMDKAESEIIAGGTIVDVARALDLASKLVAQGVAEIVVLGRGADGSVLATPDRALHCAPPPVPVRSRVGAGDSFTGAFALTLARNGDPGEALRQGTAAAAAAVMTEGSALCRAEDVARIAPQCILTDYPSTQRSAARDG